MKVIHLQEVPSTNTWLLEALTKDAGIEDMTLVYTLRQTNGRGQVGNTWESEEDKNISFSLLLRPVFLPIPQQFLISELCCLGILDGLKKLSPVICSSQELCIKWPNDIYWGDEKLGGILIENRLMGGSFSESVLGVGLNVNQREWFGGAPNPTSLLLKGIDLTPEQVLESVSDCIATRYCKLKENPDYVSAQIHSEFIKHLYRRVGYFPYRDARTKEQFMASIVDVDPHGPIVLKKANGEYLKYWFKEVQFVLPCGVIKE